MDLGFTSEELAFRDREPGELGCEMSRFGGMVA